VERVRVSPERLKTGTLRVKEGTLSENVEQRGYLSRSEGNSSRGGMTLKNP